jgi:hypothetical protein
MTNAAFTPFPNFLLEHYHCRQFHCTLTSPLYASEVPELCNKGTNADVVVATVQHGHCVYVNSVSFNTKETYGRLSFEVPKKDAFPPHGMESIILRLPLCVRLVGVLNGPKMIGAYEFEVKKGQVVNCRGIAVVTKEARTVYPSRSFVNTLSPDKMSLFMYVTQLELILSLMDDDESNVVVPSIMTYHASEEVPCCYSIVKDGDMKEMVQSMLGRTSNRVFEVAYEGLPYYPAQYLARSTWIGERSPIQPHPNFSRPHPITHKLKDDEYFLRTLGELPTEVAALQRPHHGPKMTPQIVHDHMEDLGLLKPSTTRSPPKTATPKKTHHLVTLKEHDFQWSSTTAVVRDPTPPPKEVLTVEESEVVDKEVDYTSTNYNTRPSIEVDEYVLPPSIFPVFMTRLASWEPERFVLNHQGRTVTLAHFGTPFWPSTMPPPTFLTTNSQLEDVDYSFPEEKIVKMNDYLVSMLFEFIWDVKKHFEKNKPFRGDLPELLIRPSTDASSSSSSSAARTRDDTDLGRLQLVLDPDTLNQLNTPVPFLAGHHRDLASWDYCPLWNRIVGSWARDVGENHSRVWWNEKFKVYLVCDDAGNFPSRPCWSVAKENRGRRPTERSLRRMDDHASPYQQSPSMNQRPAPAADCQKGPSNVAILRPYNPQQQQSSNQRSTTPQRQQQQQSSSHYRRPSPPRQSSLPRHDDYYDDRDYRPQQEDGRRERYGDHYDDRHNRSPSPQRRR